MAMRHLKKASTAQLIQEAITFAGDEPSYATDNYRLRIRVLCQRKPGVPIFDAAVALCESEDRISKCVGTDILDALNADWKRYHFPFAERSAPVLDRLLDDPDANVVLAALQAISQLGGVPAARLVPLAEHASMKVRFGLIDALSIEEDDIALRTVIALSQDEDGRVRDWATFRLGTSQIDSAPIREALVARLKDSDDDARGEAIVGLARRQDPRVAQAIGPELDFQTTSKRPNDFAVEAAELMPSRAYVPALELMLARDPENERISNALARCRGA